MLLPIPLHTLPDHFDVFIASTIYQSSLFLCVVEHEAHKAHRGVRWKAQGKFAQWKTFFSSFSIYSRRKEKSKVMPYFNRKRYGRTWQNEQPSTSIPNKKQNVCNFSLQIPCIKSREIGNWDSFTREKKNLLASDEVSLNVPRTSGAAASTRATPTQISTPQSQFTSRKFVKSLAHVRITCQSFCCFFKTFSRDEKSIKSSNNMLEVSMTADEEVKVDNFRVLTVLMSFKFRLVFAVRNSGWNLIMKSCLEDDWKEVEKKFFKS